MSVTKYALLRRRLRLSHHAATQVSGVDWRSLGMGVYRGTILVLAWAALLSVLHLIETLLDEREQAVQETHRVRSYNAALEGNVVQLLNGRPAFMNASYTEWVVCRNVEAFETPRESIGRRI